MWGVGEGGANPEDGVYVRQGFRILLCRCEYAPVLPPGAADLVAQGLRERGLPFQATIDLCELAAKSDPHLPALGECERLLVIACRPRSVRWLLHAGGVDPGPQRLVVLDLRELSVEEILSRVDALIAGEGSSASAPAFPTATDRSGDGRGAGDAREEQTSRVDAPDSPPAVQEKGEWLPWFPVIDYDRCCGCKQCVSFCLFGTYAIEAGVVRVANPANCKTWCPACARLCPNAAILFPKYSEGVISGTEDAPASRPDAIEAVRVDVRKATDGDVLAKLRARGKRRFATDGDGE